MVEYILGNYLTEKEIISKPQLKQILEKMDGTRVKMGLLAVEEGMLTPQQATEINRLQAVMDQRFGDIAVVKGFLTQEQVESLLRKQGNGYLAFVQTLIDEEIMKLEEVNALLAEFAAKNGFGENQIEDLKSDDVDRIIPLYIPKEAEKYTEIIGTIVRALIRLVDRHTYIGTAEVGTDFPSEDKASQRLEWEDGLVDAFSEKDGGLLKLCSIFCKEEFEQLDEDSLDAAGELLNCANGLYVSALSRQGKFLELMPPELGEGEEETKSQDVCRVPVHLGDKSLYFTVAEIK